MRAYLGARWRGTSFLAWVDDATQETFFDFFRGDGALSRLDPGRPGGFRAFLYGVVRNAALHVETRCRRAHAREADAHPDLDALEGRAQAVEKAFDRAWAVALVREALALQRERAGTRGEAALKRTEILRLRFGEGLPLRDIAHRWNVEPARLYREHARAREEFREALGEVLALQHPGDPPGAERAFRELLSHFDVVGDENAVIRGPEGGREGVSPCTTTGQESPKTPPMP